MRCRLLSSNEFPRIFGFLIASNNSCCQSVFKLFDPICRKVYMSNLWEVLLTSKSRLNYLPLTFFIHLGSHVEMPRKNSWVNKCSPKNAIFDYICNMEEKWRFSSKFTILFKPFCIRHHYHDYLHLVVTSAIVRVLAIMDPISKAITDHIN